MRPKLKVSQRLTVRMMRLSQALLIYFLFISEQHDTEIVHMVNIQPQNNTDITILLLLKELNNNIS